MHVRRALLASIFFVGSGIFCLHSRGEQAAHALPQAVPGSGYAAQLAIPPGLGYPFAKCELLGDAPRWLTLDCARLQLKGKVPAASAKDADLRLTLRVEDNAGNAREFPLSLRVSAEPQVVSLDDSPPPPAPPSPLTEPPTPAAAQVSAAPPAPAAARPTAAQRPRAQAGNAPELRDVALAESKTAPVPEADASASMGSAAPAPREAPAVAPEDGAGPAGKPMILSPLNAGSPTISVSSPKGYLTFFSLLPVPQNPDAANCADLSKADSKPVLLQLKKTSTDATPMTTVEATADKVVLVYPQQSLVAGTVLCAVRTETATPPDPSTPGLDVSNAAVVADALDWGRVRAYFVGGALISNNQNSFSSSSANEFLDLNVDKFWVVPDCASVLNTKGDCDKRPFLRWPGISSYFETRLTAIPVAVASASAAGSASAPTQSTNALTTQKTARVMAGAYFPYILANWNYNNGGNALYIAPIAKVGFDTLTGTTNPTGTVASSTGAATSATASLNRVYNFYSFGARVGHFGLYPTKSKSPELQSYLDVNFGPYSNLPSFICVPASAGTAIPAGVSTSCGAAPYASLPNASEKRIWRLDLEGLLKIPATPLVIGFNANIGQRAIGSQHLDALRAPADDVRFLFGTKFDVATVMKKLGVSQ